MPNIQRLYIIVHNNNFTAAETAAEEVDVAGIGTGSFQDGAVLSADGGTTHTHSAANVLRPCIDTDAATDFYASVPFDAVYGCTDKLGEGDVYRFDGTEYTGPIGTGDLESVALSDAGLDTYQTETLV
jgi:hypothetical protein